MSTENKYLLPADEVEQFNEAKYQKNLKENGPFSNDGGMGVDE